MQLHLSFYYNEICIFIRHIFCESLVKIYAIQNENADNFWDSLFSDKAKCRPAKKTVSEMYTKISKDHLNNNDKLMML